VFVLAERHSLFVQRLAGYCTSFCVSSSSRNFITYLQYVYANEPCVPADETEKARNCVSYGRSWFTVSKVL